MALILVSLVLAIVTGVAGIAYGVRTARRLVYDALKATDDPYDVALRVTDEVLGKGTFARINANHPDPKVQAAIQRAEKARPTPELG